MVGCVRALPQHGLAGDVQMSRVSVEDCNAAVTPSEVAGCVQNMHSERCPVKYAQKHLNLDHRWANSARNPCQRSINA
jgi:hypothetical protein